MNDWVDLEHQLWQELKENAGTSQKILVGFSGGVDSLALLWSLFRVLKQNVEACYVHHGAGGNDVYRDKALQFCQKFCADHGIPFHIRKNTAEVLTSEAALREYRYQQLREVCKQVGAGWIALAHHRDDLLETRLLRLIRGTGPQGLVAMRPLQDGLFRPFLKISKSDLQSYLNKFSIEALADPSNEDLEPLRNWIRQSWLVDLEKRQEGAVHALARSLETLVDSQAENDRENGDFKNILHQNTLLRAEYLALSKIQQKQVLAKLLLSQNVRNFTQSHVEEVLRRLDNSQKEFTFKVAGMNWVINAQQIRVQESE